MSFRDAASSVRAGIKSGAYQKKTDNFAAFAQGFAPVFAQQMKDKKDLKMAELKTIAEEKRWDRRQAAKAQEEIDKYDKKTLEVATQVASELGVDPNNTAAMAMITPFVAGTNNNFKSSYEHLKKHYNWDNITSPDNSTATQSPTSTAAVTSQAIGWTDPLSKGEGNDNIDALLNLTKGKLSGKYANYKVSQNTIGANLDFARKGGESGYFDSSIGLVAGRPNSGTTPMGKWQFVHSTLEDIANRTNNFKDLGEGFENGLNTIFDAKAQDKIHAWYINDTLNQARKDGPNTRDNFVYRLKARYEAFQKKNPDTGKKFTDQEILNIVNPFVASEDKTTWATGGSWFGTVDYGDSQPVSNHVAAQTDAALVDGADSSSSLPTKLPELFSSKQEAMQIASRKDHPKYQQAVEYLKFDKEYGRATSAEMIAGVNSLPELAAFETSVALMEETDPRKAILTAEIPKLRTKLEKFAPNAGQPDYMVDTVTTGNIADFTANVDAELKGMSKDDPNRMALLDRSLHLKTVQADFDAAKKNNSKFKLLKSYQFIKYKDKDGKEKRVQVQLTDQGGLYYRGDFIDRENVISYEPTSDQIVEAVNLANKFTADFGDKLRQTKTDTITLVSTAKQLDDLVRANPDILTIVGGEGSTFISGLITELNQVAKAINGPQMSSAKLQEQLLTAGDQKIREFVQNSTDSYVKNNAQAFYQFTALNLKHAFSFAKLSLDSAGMALSNFDFKNSLTINNVGKDYKTYSKNLRTMTSGVLRDATGRHDLLLENLEFNLAMENDLIKQKMTGTDTIMPLSDFITRQLPDAVNWATSTVDGTTSGGTEDGSGGSGSTVLPDFNAFLNNPEELQARFALYRQVVADGDDEDLEKFYQRTANRFYGPNYTNDNLSFVKDSLLDRFSSMGGN